MGDYHARFCERFKVKLLLSTRLDGCDCAEILRLIAEGKIDTTPLITHRFPLDKIEEAYCIFENRQDGVIKVAITEKAM